MGGLRTATQNLQRLASVPNLPPGARDLQAQDQQVPATLPSPPLTTLAPSTNPHWNAPITSTWTWVSLSSLKIPYLRILWGSFQSIMLFETAYGSLFVRLSCVFFEWSLELSLTQWNFSLGGIPYGFPMVALHTILMLSFQLWCMLGGNVWIWKKSNIFEFIGGQNSKFWIN